MRKASSKKGPKSSSSLVRPVFSSSRKERNWGGDGTLICPDSVCVKLPFTQTLTPGTTSGGLYSYQYRGNSCFDPDYTGVGSQPNGFDQWSQFYNTYVVLSSEIVVEFLAGTNAATELVIVPAFNTSLPANSKEAAGWRFAKTNIHTYAGNGVYGKTICQMDTATICGVPPQEVVYDTDFSAAVSTSPSNNNTWYWDIFLQNINNSTTLADVMRVTIFYDVKFMAPVQQAFSLFRQPQLACAKKETLTRQVNDDSCVCVACTQSANLPASCKRQ
jgi:hypothetical protein